MTVCVCSVHANIVLQAEIASKTFTSTFPVTGPVKLLVKNLQCTGSERDVGEGQGSGLVGKGRQATGGDDQTEGWNYTGERVC